MGFHSIKNKVTPFVGVWIETFGQCQKKWGLGVTPFVGVWIETEETEPKLTTDSSHPSWVCGLKPFTVINSRLTLSHTLRGCVD